MKICLNMIVKNETKVIRRCLDSLKSIIDYWVIVDTGSSDGTQGMIKEHMKNMPGELHERPWVNFAHNRNQALELAKGKGDYTLFIDADETLVFDKDFKIPDLDKDFYHIMTLFGGTKYARVQLVKDSLNWKWAGVLHEAVDCADAKTNEILIGVHNHVYTDGARSQDPDKYKKDVKILQEALKAEPNNARYAFYLAQSYKDSGDLDNALKYYTKRTEMGGWVEEIFYSLTQIGVLQRALDKPAELISATLTKAYHYRPTRVEPLYYLAEYYRMQENYAQGYLIASIAARIPVTKDLLFIQKWMYDWGISLELSICAYWIGKYEESLQISHRILANPNIPQNVRECVERNVGCTNSKLLELYTPANKAL
jgi:glycosyltransferase involved in cell wall biosynthesis